MILKESKMGIKAKMTIQFSTLFLLGLLIIGLFLYQGMANVLQNVAINYIQETLKQTNNKLEQMLNEVVNHSSQAIGNFQMQLLLNEATLNPNMSLNNRQQINQILNNGIGKHTYIDSIFLHSQDFGFYGFSNGSFSLKEIQEYVENQGELPEPSPNNMSWMTINYKGVPYLIAIREIPNFLNPKPLGYYYAVINGNKLNKDFKSMDIGEGGLVFLLDEYQKIMFGSSFSNKYQDIFQSDLIIPRDKQGVGYFIESVQGVKSLITFSNLANTGWATVGVLPISSLTSEISYMKNILVWAGLISVLIISICAGILSGRITRPILNLQRKMREVEEGNLDVQLEETTHILEMNDLGHSFNHMTNRLKKLINEVYKERVRQRDAELKALQANINPHFLYNTLDSIYWMLVMREQEEEARLILSLSNLFRYITDYEDVVTLETEFEQIQNYLNIQKVRFEDMQVDCYLDSTIRHVKILKLLLQPLVENSIFHGLESKTSNRKINIEAYKVKDTICITITDNGLGISAEQLEVIRQKLQNSSHEDNTLTHKGMGIENVHQRIQLKHGMTYGLHIDSCLHEGTTVQIILPFKDDSTKQIKKKWEESA